MLVSSRCVVSVLAALFHEIVSGERRKGYFSSRSVPHKLCALCVGNETTTPQSRYAIATCLRKARFVCRIVCGQRKT